MTSETATIPAEMAELYSKCKPLVEYMRQKYLADDALVITSGRVTLYKQFIDIPLICQSEWLGNFPE